MRIGLVASAFILLSSLGASQAIGATAVYTISGNGSGSLNGVSFTNADFTFTLTGDTSNLSGNVLDPLTTAVVNVAGLGSTTITIPTRLGECGICGNVTFFSRSGSGGADLFDFSTSTVVDLGTSFGPLTGTDIFALNQFDNVASTAGPLTFTASSNVQFSGLIGALGVPEPSTWAMMLLGFGAIGLAMRRKATRAMVPAA